MDDLIKRSDAIKIMACEMYAEAQSQGYEVDSIEDFMPEAKAWMNDAPPADRPSAVDLSSVYSTAYKSGYEKGKADRPQGEWIPYEASLNFGDGESYVIEHKCSACGYLWGEPDYKFCPYCGARMKGADNEGVDSNR